MSDILQNALMMQARLAPPPPVEVNDSNMLQTAQAMRIASSRGQTPTSGMQMGGVSPLQQAVQRAKALAASSLDPDSMEDGQLDQVGQMVHDPNVSYQMFNSALGSLRQGQKANKKNATPQPHNWGGQQAKQGTIDIAQGDGPNRMSDAAFTQWQNRVNSDAANGGGAPGTVGVQTGDGYIHATTEPTDSQSDDPIVSLVNSVKGKVSDQTFNELKAFADSGANAQQLHAAIQHGEDVDTRQADMQQRQQASAANSKRRMQLSTLQHQMPVLQQQMKGLENAYFGIEGAADAKSFAGGDPNATAAFNQYQTLKQKQATLQSNMEHLAEGGDEDEQPATEQPTQGKKLDVETAKQLYQQAGGDPNKARQLASQMGFQF